MTAVRPTVIVPVKPFAEAKTRLAPLLSPLQRADLSRRLCRHVLGTVQSLADRVDCLVVSRSDAVLALAEGLGARGLRETGHGLNAALREALQAVPAKGGVLLLSSDLPLLDRSDIAALLAQPAADVVVATDRHGTGTNALYLAGPGLIAPQFGPRSHMAHRAAALAAGLRFVAVDRPGLATDLDTPDDLAWLRPRLPAADRNSGLRDKSARLVRLMAMDALPPGL